MFEFKVASQSLLDQYLLMLRRYLHIVFVGVLLLPLAGLGQTPIKVPLCDLARNPQKYSGQWVEVRGGMQIGFENFTLQTSGCGDVGEFRRIWLDYGSEMTPTASTANDRTRPQGGVLKVGNTPVQLDRDESFDLFQRRLYARRLMTPSGIHCYEECSLYRVTATFTGLFMAATTGTGYGHMGCCHLLTISRVKDVEAKRTEVPAGGQFTCTKETWEMDRAQAMETQKHRECTSVNDCTKAFSEQVGPIAAHWHDELATDKGTPAYGMFSAAPGWISADMLTNYTVATHYSKKHQRGDVTGATVTRTSCKATEPPYPMSTPIGCKDLVTQFEAASKEKTGLAESAQPVESWHGTPESIAPQALAKAAKLWGVRLLPGLKLENCSKPKVFKGEQFSECKWSDPTGMQSFNVRVSRSRLLHQIKGWDNTPWQLTSGYGFACAAESQP
ncbi:MAG TPA: hypothetical protein VFR24_24285 [Candidatus Angelobacter sp.]|nr:hypothetical protein [Candidatus Angelobacter sp.]